MTVDGSGYVTPGLVITNLDNCRGAIFEAAYVSYIHMERCKGMWKLLMERSPTRVRFSIGALWAIIYARLDYVRKWTSIGKTGGRCVVSGVAWARALAL